MMENLIKLSELITKGDHASEALKIIAPYAKEVRETVFDKWCESEGSDTQGRERLYFLVRALIEIERACVGNANKGKRAKAKVNNE